MVVETKCRRCGKNFCILSVAQWSYKIGNKFYCGYNCKNAELGEQETKDRIRVETTLEHKLDYDRKYKAMKYRIDKEAKGKSASVHGYKPRPGNYRTRAVLKIDAFDGRVVKKYPSVIEASRQEFMTKSALSRRINGKNKRAEEFIWRYEDEYESDKRNINAGKCDSSH